MRRSFLQIIDVTRYVSFLKYLAISTAILIAMTYPASVTFKVAGNGRAECVIIRQPNATAEESKAIDDLARILEQVTGAKFTVQTSLDDMPSSAIIVGQGAAARKAFPNVAFDRLDPEQIVIQTKGQRLLLAGGQSAETVNAVYKFLQDFVGYRWWTPWAATIPFRSELSLPEINLTEKPAFGMRFVGWFYGFYHYEGTTNPNDKEWGTRNLINGCNCGRVMAHNFHRLVPPDIHFEKHSLY
jgi:hypothetical protein